MRLACQYEIKLTWIAHQNGEGKPIRDSVAL